MPANESNNKKAEAGSLAVQPLESVPNEPDNQADNQEPDKEIEYCWNCTNHGKKTVLSDEGHCSVCGFHKDNLYNMNIEAEKAKQRERERQQSLLNS